MGLNLKRLNDQHGLIWGINTIYQGGSHWMQCSCKNISRGPRHCLYCPRLCLGQYRQCLGPCDIFTILSPAVPWTIFLHIHLTNDILLDIYTKVLIMYLCLKFWINWSKTKTLFGIMTNRQKPNMNYHFKNYPNSFITPALWICLMKRW